MQKLKGNLLTQIFIAFVLAIIFGIVFKQRIDVIKPLGDLFLRLIKFIIVPLVLTSLVTGVASIGDVKKLGRLGGKTIVYYLGTTAIAVTLGLIIGNVFSPGTGLDIEVAKQAVQASEPTSLIDTFLAIVPTNPLEALVSGNMLQIIFFAIFVGLGITMIGEKGEPLYRLFDASAEVMYKITEIVMRFAPIGVLGLVAPVVGKYGIDVLLPLLKVIFAVAFASFLHMIITYSLAVKGLGKMSPVTFFKGILPASLVAFSTSSSSGTLPVTIKSVEENLGVSKRISSFVLPLGATINMDGTAIYQGVSALFIAQFFGIHLTIAQQVTVILTATLASVGTAGVPGAGLIMLTMVLKSVNLPLEGIALIGGIDRVLDMLRTTVNVTGDASAAVVVAASEGELDRGI